MRSRRPLLAILCILASLLVPGIASASTASGAETRVRAFDFAEQVHVGGSAALTLELRPGCEPTYDQLASDSLLAARGAVRFADPKFAAQLERQLSEHGSSSIFKSLRSLERRLAEHKAKLPVLQFKSSVEREIRTFQNQIDTLKEFIKQKGLTP